MLPEDKFTQSVVLTGLGVLTTADGIRRLNETSDKGQDRPAQGMNSIAAKAINPLKISTGIQDGGMPLPAGVVAGQAPQQLAINQQQVQIFEEDGVIMIRGAMKEWV